HRAANPDELAYLQRVGDVSRAVLLRAIARVPGTERSALVELKAVDRAYPLYGAVQLEPAMPLTDALAFADGAHGAAVDQSLLDRLGLKRGDIVEVGAARFRIAATIAVEPDRLAGGRTINLGPRFLASDDALAAADRRDPQRDRRSAARIPIGRLDRAGHHAGHAVRQPLRRPHGAVPHRRGPHRASGRWRGRRQRGAALPRHQD